MSFWHDPYRSVTGKLYMVPKMAGYGGNIVELMPNGIIGFRIGNGGEKTLEPMLSIAERIRPYP
jgi:hypothetical protein